jgi:hypothetical protein
MPGNDNAPLGAGGVNQVLAAGGLLAPPTLPTPPDIVRGSAGDCCILCGKVGIHLPVDHGCQPNIDVEAHRARVAERTGWWDR